MAQEDPIRVRREHQKARTSIQQGDLLAQQAYTHSWEKHAKQVQAGHIGEHLEIAVKYIALEPTQRLAGQADTVLLQPRPSQTTEGKDPKPWKVVRFRKAEDQKFRGRTQG